MNRNGDSLTTVNNAFHDLYIVAKEEILEAMQRLRTVQ